MREGYIDIRRKLATGVLESGGVKHARSKRLLTTELTPEINADASMMTSDWLDGKGSKPNHKEQGSGEVVWSD